MKRFLLLLVGLFAATAAGAADDARSLVPMPAAARAEMRAEMLDFQSALHLIVGSLAGGDFAGAADTAERQMGLSAMGRHRQAPPEARPGMHMPKEMHDIARGLHAAASDFAKVARGGDLAKSVAALQLVTGQCVGCHRSYRVQ
jgi:hypothetical protein